MSKKRKYVIEQAKRFLLRIGILGKKVKSEGKEAIIPEILEENTYLNFKSNQVFGSKMIVGYQTGLKKQKIHS